MRTVLGSEMLPPFRLHRIPQGIKYKATERPTYKG